MMRSNLFYLLPLCLVASCSQNKVATNFTLTASDLSDELNGKYIYLFTESRVPVDSVLINDGSFTIIVDSVSPYNVYSISDKETGSVAFVPEAGIAELHTENGTLQDAYVYSVKTELGLNDLLRAYSIRKSKVEEPLNKKHYAWLEKMENSAAMSEAEVANLRAEKDSLDDIYVKTMADFRKKEYESNKNNVVGAIVFCHLEYDSKADFIQKYEAAPEAVKENSFNKEMYALYKKSLGTKKGAHFPDVEMTNDMGTTKKISEFRKEGAYLLLDFWASWCGPCRAAMPHLAELHEKLSENLVIVSIGGLQETPDQNQKAREELHITWETFFDKESEAADVYGVTAIPNLILIDPNGTIVVRTNDPAEVDKKLVEAGLLSESL